MDNEQQQELALKSLGGVLLLARTEAGLSQDDIAQKLYLSKTAIVHIENDELDKLEQSPVFIRGYVRRYARLVNLDENEVTELLDKLGVKASPMKEKSYMLARRQASVSDKKFRWLTYGVIMLLVILLFIWWHSHVNDKTTIMPPSIHAMATVATQSTPASSAKNSMQNIPTNKSTNPTDSVLTPSPATNKSTPNATNAKQIKSQLTMDNGS